MNAIAYLVDDPVGQCAIAPFLAAAILTLSIRLVFGAALGTRIASLAIVLAFIGGYLLILGVPPFPPVSSTQKLFYVAVIATIIGLALDLTRSGPVLRMAATWLVPPGVLIWLATRLLVPLSSRILLELAALVVGTMAVKWCLARADPHEVRPDMAPALAPSILVMVATAGLGITAFFGGAPIIAQLGFVLASASGGYILVAWLFHVLYGENFRFGMIGQTGIFDATAAVAYIYLLFSEQPNRAAVLILCLIFAAHFVASPLAQMVRPARAWFGRALRPICYGLVVSFVMALEIIYERFFAGDLLKPD